MGRHGNRKHDHKHSHHHDHRKRRNSSDFGVADALHSVKRRRLSEEGSDVRSLRRDGNSATSGTMDEDGWQTVPSRSSKQRNKRNGRSATRNSAYPELTFGRKVTKPVMIEQLRDLALYVLADGIGPDWVAIKNARSIAKVVTIMVPGLDQEALKRSRVLLSILRRKWQEQQSQERRQNEQVIGDTQEQTNGNQRSDLAPEPLNTDDLSATITSDSIEEFLDLLDTYHHDWLLNDTIPVKAPGDVKFSKVHSPLQAMLVTPENTDKTKPKQPVDKQVKPVATPITHYIHTADELREAEYPIHPAAFTSAADAMLESSRRESTEQSKAAGWVDSEVSEPGPLVPPISHANARDSITQGLDIYAIDCEMVLTSDQKSSLARISVVSWPNGKVVIDKYVKPDLPIENYFTQFSGITARILEPVTTKLSDIQQDLGRILTPSTVLLGHSLESDLNALKMTHPFIVDTSMVYPHPRGLPLRSSLKFLANKYLRREIQSGGANGHDSVEDARAVLDLVKLKCERGPKFGTTEANGEPIFRRLGRHTGKEGIPLTSAIVEYGSSPERGLGKNATYAIGCQNDEEITAGMLRAIKGDDDGKEIPAGGVNFVWGRLRMLEFVRGWMTKGNVNTNSSTTTSTSADTNEQANLDNTNDSESSQDAVDKSLLSTLRHIATIRNALPPTTLLIIYSGTSDVRPVIKLQAIQAQYRKEFKVKKWDELTVKWTDVEEQALRNAAERARQGWGWVGVV